MRIERPQRPTYFPAYSEACLQAFVESGLSHAISLGGAFGELHYYDYRPTHDVAQRAALLEPLDNAEWINVPLDSLADLLASKMTALVERGAPRDFRDVYSACQAGLITPAECWAVWAKRQRLAGNDADLDRACLAIETHLARISQHRRLEQIADPQQQAEASEVRRWFEEELLNAADSAAV